MHPKKDQATTEQNRVLGVAALRALGHPLRARIFDLLSQYGPQTSSTLAELMGESSGSTSYHLRILARQNLIREIPERSSGRERWWERPPGGVTMDGAEIAHTPAGRAALQVAVAETHRLRYEELTEFLLQRAEREPEEWQRASTSITASTRMTAAQLEEVSRKIDELITETIRRYRHQEGDDVRPVTLRADLFPLKAPGATS
ncbi:helix-turn-helix domain-containing protein [Microbacterium sp. NPDC096154]|uniref:winged helix-turn-helix domain-containing protein n=1 Tax=Microbacterium sp. NPDC096154 TaxID=3155549 RepID=UPI0033274385